MMEVVTVAVQCIALTILNSMMNVFKSVIFNHLERFFDKESIRQTLIFKLSYYITVIMSFCICYLADFCFFTKLGLEFRIIEIDYILTAFLLAGSTRFLNKVYDLVDENIPMRFDSIATNTAKKGKSIIDNIIHSKNQNEEEKKEN